MHLLLTIIHFTLGLSAVLGLAFASCEHRSAISTKNLPRILVVEFIVAWFFLKSDIGIDIIEKISLFFQKLMSFADTGTTFVFGNLINQPHQFNFFLNALVPIVFMSSLIGILNYTKFFNKIASKVGFILNKISGVGQLESYNAVNAMIFGQSENFIVYKNTLKYFSEEQLFTLTATAMSTISMSIIGTYMTMIPPRLVITGLFLNMFSTFVILTIVNPYKRIDDGIDLSFNESDSTFFETLSEYIIAGFKISVIVAAMLIGFISLISMANSAFDSLFGVTFQRALGYCFSPLAIIIGVPFQDAISAGAIMATKIVSNEFVALKELVDARHAITAASFNTIGVFLISFANLSSIGIITGAVKAIDEKQGNITARFGIKLVYTSTLISMLSAIFASVFN